MNKGVSFRRRLLKTAGSKKEIRAICFSTLNPNEQQTVKCDFATTLNINLQYSTNGVNFQNYTDGQEITFGGENKVWFRGKNDRLSDDNDNDKYTNFKLLDNNVLTRCDGNIMHLLDYEQNLNSLEGSIHHHAFAKVFYSCIALYSCPDILVENANTKKCFLETFLDCVNLNYIPKITTKKFGNDSFSNIFKNCSNLKGNLNLTIDELYGNGYFNSSFYNTSINTVKIVINVYGVGNVAFKNCFYNCCYLEEAVISGNIKSGNGALEHTFQNCTKLKTFNKNNILIADISSSSSTGIFDGCCNLKIANIQINGQNLPTNALRGICTVCTKLPFAPELYVESFSGSYALQNAFDKCYNLRYIKCLYDYQEGENVNNFGQWTNNLADKGVFVKKDTAIWPIGNDGIPNGWIIKNDSEKFLEVFLEKEVFDKNEECELYIVSNVNWQIESYPNWMSLDKLEGEGNCILKIASNNVQKFERGQIVVKNLYDNSTKEVTIICVDKFKQELTFVVSSNGTIRWKFDPNGDPIPKIIEYTKDGGTTWTSITSSNDTSLNGISVSKGDIISFRGNNAAYAQDNNIGSQFNDNGCVKCICGNIMSLINSANFENLTQLTQPFALHTLFKSFTGLIDASNLSLPATILTQSCYRGMFEKCSKLLYAPELPASQLVQDCYRYMFYNCFSLIYIKCLCDTNIQTDTYTQNWLAGRNTNACKFVKKSTTQIYRNDNSGIPSNWVIENV